MLELRNAIGYGNMCAFVAGTCVISAIAACTCLENRVEFAQALVRTDVSG
jgi:hypothetical protein